MKNFFKLQASFWSVSLLFISCSTEITENNMLLDNNKIKYKKLVGKGGYGEVYEGEYNGAKVAIKKLLNSNNLSNQEMKEFENEIKVMTDCNHTGIVKIVGYCKLPNPCIVMEYADRGSIYDVMQEEDIPWTKRLKAAIILSSALGYLHQKNIVHRDIKSLNILLKQKEGSSDPKERLPKLGDFGLASTREETLSIKNLPNNINNERPVGTARWLAPELLLDKKPVYTSKTDIFSFGIFLWELASRKIPYSDIKNNLIVMDRVKDGHREEIPKMIPNGLESLITDCWNQDPKQRPSASEIEQRLIEILREWLPENFVSTLRTIEMRKSKFSNTNNDKRVIILGKVKNGKTSLLNMICKSDELVMDGNQSTTRNLFELSAAYNSENKTDSLTLIDTPGIGSSVEVSDHINKQMYALQNWPYDAIIIVIKSESDPEKIYQTYRTLVEPLTGPKPLNEKEEQKNYESNVILLLSHFDTHINVMKEKKKSGKDLIEEEIGKVFDKNGTYVDIITYAAQNLTSEKQDYYCDKLTKMLHRSISKLPRVVIKLDTYNFVKFAKMNSPSSAFSNYKRQCQETLDEIFYDYVRLAEEEVQSRKFNIDDVINCIALAYRKEFDIEADNFFNTASNAGLDPDDQYYLKLDLLYDIYIKNKEFNKKLESVAGASLETSKLFSGFKRCKYCKEILVKVEGCDGVTYCGERPQSKFEEIISYTKNKALDIHEWWGNFGLLSMVYGNSDTNQRISEEKKHLKFVGLEVIIETIKKDGRNVKKRKIVESEESINKAIGKKNIDYNVKDLKKEKNFKFGCGAKIIWSELDPLSSSDIIKLFQVDCKEKAQVASEGIGEELYKTLKEGHDKKIEKMDKNFYKKGEMKPEEEDDEFCF